VTVTRVTGIETSLFGTETCAVSPLEVMMVTTVLPGGTVTYSV
jgi:hypothetical protein